MRRRKRPAVSFHLIGAEECRSEGTLLHGLVRGTIGAQTRSYNNSVRYLTMEVMLMLNRVFLLAGSPASETSLVKHFHGGIGGTVLQNDFTPWWIGSRCCVARR
jgi:hypothetical protein